MSKSENTHEEWLAFSESAGIEIPGEDYYGLSGDHASAFKLATLIIESGNSYATDHPRMLKQKTSKSPDIYCFMPYSGAFYSHRDHSHITTAYSERQQHLENFVGYLNKKYRNAVMMCDVLPFSPHGDDTMTVLFYNAYQVDPSLFEKHSIMRINGKGCDEDSVKTYVTLSGLHPPK